MVEDMKELRGHIRSKHKTAWALHTKNMQEFDHTHIEASVGPCTVCAHRGGNG